MITSTIAANLNRVGLLLGLFGAIALFFAAKVGVVSSTGTVIFDGLDPMAPVEVNERRVRSSHRLHRILTPLGWALVGAAFFLQFVATFAAATP